MTFGQTTEMGRSVLIVGYYIKLKNCYSKEANMEFIPVFQNQIPEAPLQLVQVICTDYKRLTICARFAPNIKRTIVSYKVVKRIG